MALKLGKVDRKIAGVALEVVIWLALTEFTVTGLLFPLIGLAGADSPPASDPNWGSEMSQRIQVDLNDQGIQAVFGPGVVLPESGYIDLGEVTLTPSVTALVTFAKPGLADFLATTGAGLIQGLTGVAVCLCLWRVARTIRLGAPFQPRNAGRLYAAGLICLGGGIADLAVSAGGQMAATFRGTVSDLIYPGLTLRFGFFVLGTVFVMLGEVFRQGVALQAETEGLV
jgi:hypothetical protein